MPKAPLLKKLIDSGECVLYHDYRRGSFADLSQWSNDGTPTSTVWQGGGVRCLDSSGVITVGDPDELDLTTGTFVFLGEFRNIIAAKWLACKRKVGSINWDLYFADTQIALRDDSTTRVLSVSYEGKKYCGVSWINGGTPEGYLDGVSAGSFSGVININTDDADYYIMNTHVANVALEGMTVTAHLVINRSLSASEHAQLYSELLDIQWSQI